VETIKFSRSWFAVDQAVQVTLDESALPGFAGRIFSGRIMELCATGVRLRTNRPLLPGSVVQLRWKNIEISAEVRRCISAESNFLVEVKLERAVFKTEDLNQEAMAPMA
jgi:hypothetical protein